MGALRLGLKHGLACIGCCWALMMLLFVGGVMNLLWIAALSALVLLEKVVPSGRLMPRVVGLVLVAAGTIFIFGMAI
jgi:predicted metal-binding membrane protein